MNINWFSINEWPMFKESTKHLSALSIDRDMREEALRVDRKGVEAKEKSGDWVLTHYRNNNFTFTETEKANKKRLANRVFLENSFEFPIS